MATQIAVCDDEARCRDILGEYCRNYFEEKCLEYELIDYISGDELWAELKEAEKDRDSPECLCDILLLDIEMQGMSGIILKDLLQANRQEIRILFVTSHPEAMPEAFGRQVFGFLKKPLEYDKFQKKMDTVMADIRDCEKYVMLENTFGVQKILLNQLQYIQAFKKYTNLFLEGELPPIISERSLRAWRELLAEEWFYPCHKSYLVNFRQVKGVRKDEILLEGGCCIPLSRRMQKEWKEQYRKYLWEKAR